MKPRKILRQIEKAIIKPDKKIIFIWGPRQIGKSTILDYLYKKHGGSYFNFDDLEDQRVFIPELSKLSSAIEFRSGNKKNKFIFIDEVQKNPASTQAIKLLTDRKEYMVIATGSSELRAKTNYFDTLAGRYKEFILFSLTIDEVAQFKNEQFPFVRKPDFAQNDFLQKYLDELMIYGSYPAVVLTKNKIEELKNITQNSIVKDIINIYDLKNTNTVFNLLRLLAMQIGNLINITELTNFLRSTRITIDNYLTILEKNRVIFFLEPYKNNKRKGYLERKKIYFCDLGIRNSLIEDFRALHLRSDFGALFENLIVSGAMRKNNYNRVNDRLFFFREIRGAQKELDLIIESIHGVKLGFEIKYDKGIINRFSDLKINRYGLISKKNAAEFLV